MADFYVAKTYDNWPRETEPYIANGRYYVKVRSPKGDVKQVRAYNGREYAKLYKATPCASPVQPSGEDEPVLDLYAPKVKKILGFQDGYIWIFKGDVENAEYWFSKTPECRYSVLWGWYIVSTETIPADMPSCIQTVKLPWEKVGNTDETLLPKSIVSKRVEELLFDEHPSQYQGNIGERIEREVVLTKVIYLGESQYGSSTMFCFEDSEQNQYIWTTGTTKSWEIGNTLKIRATVKAHETYKCVRQTVLTRTMEVK